MCLPSIFQFERTVHNLDHPSGDLNFNQTLALTPEKCENLCSEDDETKDYCANLWKEMEFENHRKIVITLAELFALSTIEGILDGCFSWTPYNMVHDYKAVAT